MVWGLLLLLKHDRKTAVDKRMPVILSIVLPYTMSERRKVNVLINKSLRVIHFFRRANFDIKLSHTKKKEVEVGQMYGRLEEEMQPTNRKSW